MCRLLKESRGVQETPQSSKNAVCLTVQTLLSAQVVNFGALGDIKLSLSLKSNWQIFSVNVVRQRGIPPNPPLFFDKTLFSTPISTQF